MFDKLIESSSVKANFRPRRRFFLVSSVIVGALFLTGVIASLYAQEISLGIGDLESAVLLSPVANEQPKVEEQQAAAPQKQDQVTADRVPERQVAMMRTDESPKTTPTTIISTPNTVRSQPYLDYKFGTKDIDLGSGAPIGPTSGFRGTGGPSVGTPSAPEVKTEASHVVDAPPVLAKAAAKNTTPISVGVITGRATYLPKPVYPAPAIALNVQGSVSVQVTIDETGKVIASRAVSGHPLLKGVAEKAAWSAKFTPTQLSKVPVKVTGIIVFNFVRG